MMSEQTVFDSTSDATKDVDVTAGVSCRKNNLVRGRINNVGTKATSYVSENKVIGKEKRRVEDVDGMTVFAEQERKRRCSTNSGWMHNHIKFGNVSGWVDMTVTTVRREQDPNIQVVDLTTDEVEEVATTNSVIARAGVVQRKQQEALVWGGEASAEDVDEVEEVATTNSVIARAGVVQRKRQEALVWGGEASAKDVAEIKEMIRTGSGVRGHWNCKLELKESLLENAGKGVFLKAGCTLRNGECVTEYSGKCIKSARGLSNEEELRTIETERLMIKGTDKLIEGDGFGSFVNSSVAGRTHSFCRFVTYNDKVYMMASYIKEQYTLRGPVELYLTAGHAWWSLFNSLKRK